MKTELLDDVLEKNLKIVFCGMAASEFSAKVGGYYANTKNRFWETLYDLNFTGHKIKSYNYREILEYEFGLTDLVKNQSGVDSEIIIKEKDIKKAINKLKNKLREWNPEILAFNGRKPAEIFLNKHHPSWGKQNEKQISSPEIWVLPSTSRLNTWWKAKNHEKIWKNLYQKIKNI